MRSASPRHADAPRRAGVTPLTLLSLSLLITVVAFVLDGGMLTEQRRHVQAAADAAALAAASDLFAHYPANQGVDSQGTATASALATAAANGFANDGVTSVVTVTTSPHPYLAGPNAGQPVPPGYVEVLVQYNSGGLFSGVFGSGSVQVLGRAVARGRWGPNGNDVVLLNTKSPDVLSLGANASLTVNGGVLVNSPSSSAIATGNSAVTATQFALLPGAGAVSGLQGPGGTAPTIRYATAPSADPLRALPAPDPARLGLPRGTAGWGGNALDLYPGIYPGGIQLGGVGTVVLHANSDGTPGIYYLQKGGLVVNGQGVMTTAPNEKGGVLIYVDWSGTDGDGDDGVSISGQGTLSLAPPSSGPYRGVSIFMARGSPTQQAPPINIDGNGTLNVTGTIYAAYGSVNFAGNATGVLGGQIIADTLSIQGNANLAVNPGANPIAGTRLLGLVE